MLQKMSFWILLILINLLLISGCSNKQNIKCTVGPYLVLKFDNITMGDAQSQTINIAKILGLPQGNIECLKELF